MKNKVIIFVVIILFALTGAFIWYAFNQDVQEDGASDDFNQENSLENAEGFQFNELPEPAPTPEELEQQPTESSNEEVDLSTPPAPEPVPSFDASQFQGVEEPLDIP